MNYRYYSILLFISILLIPLSVIGQSTSGLSGQFFFSYEKFLDDREVDNEFSLKRGYVNFRHSLRDNVQIRFTQDVSVDQEGDGRGNIELRVKYAFVNIQLKDAGIIRNPNFELGVVRRPWIDFEQSINDFRSQGSMFLDQNNITSSADYGLSLSGDLGEELPEHLQDGIRSGHGSFGSFSLGIYNGGGYSALEENSNKLLEGRISLRPLADRLPGLQLSFNGAYGKGNIPESPDFRLAASALSFESPKWIFIAQGFLSEGDDAGNFIQPDFEAIHLKGWSAFSEIKPFSFPVSLTLRYDELYNQDSNRWISKKAIIGLAYVFSNRSKIILDADRRWTSTLTDQTSFYSLEVVAEIRF